MNVFSISLVFFLYFCTLFSTRDTRMICKQNEFGDIRILICPPVNNTEMEDLAYCCSNNGLMDCCNYDDYNLRHMGSNSLRTMIIVFCEVTLVVCLALWCYICGCRK